MTPRIPLWGFALAFVVQAVLLGYMLVDRVMLLANGTEIRLPVVPVDPRDFLRGDYVILAYPMSQLKAADLGGENEFSYDDPIFVELARDGDIWKPKALSKTQPEGVTSIRGTVTGSTQPSGCSDASCSEITADYNLEQFFVPEGKGRDLEKLRNDQHLQVDVAVADNGRAALKRLRVDGEIEYEEKLF